VELREEQGVGVGVRREPESGVVEGGGVHGEAEGVGAGEGGDESEEACVGR